LLGAPRLQPHSPPGGPPAQCRDRVDFAHPKSSRMGGSSRSTRSARASCRSRWTRMGGDHETWIAGRARRTSTPASQARIGSRITGSMAYTRLRRSIVDRRQRTRPASTRTRSWRLTAGLLRARASAMSDGCLMCAAMSATIWRLVASARSSMPSALRLGMSYNLLRGGSPSMRRAAWPALISTRADRPRRAVLPLERNQRGIGAGVDVSPRAERKGRPTSVDA
jgi:hypothetical protein